MSRCVSYSNGHIVAEERGFIEKDGFRKLSTIGAVYDDQGCLINQTFREAPDSVFVGDKFSDKASNDSINRLPGNSIYLGVLHWHFGHFIIETMPRFWVFLDDPSLLECDHFVFQAWGNLSSTALFSPQIRRIFELFNIPISKIKLVSESLQLESLHIPDSSWDLTTKPDSRLRDLVAHIRDNICLEDTVQAATNLFLSRSKLAPDQRRIVNESSFYRSDDDEGTAILHPQELSLDHQIQCMASASRIAAFEGTALYMAMFSADDAEIDCLSFRELRFFRNLLDVEDRQFNHKAIQIEKSSNRLFWGKVSHGVLSPREEVLVALDDVFQCANSADTTKLEQSIRDCLKSELLSSELSYLVKTLSRAKINLAIGEVDNCFQRSNITAALDPALAVNLVEYALITKKPDLAEATLLKVDSRISEYPELFELVSRSQICLDMCGLDKQLIIDTLEKMKPAQIG